MKSPEVLVLFNRPSAGGNSSSPFRESEEGVLEEVKAVEEALRSLGIRSRSAAICSLPESPGVIASGREAVVFNLIEALEGATEDVCAVPDVIRALGRSATGGDSRCLSLTLDKGWTKAVLKAGGMPTPWWFCVDAGGPLPEVPPDRFPLIVKPLKADASEGIDDRSVVRGPEALRAAVERIWNRLDQTALVEQFIDGREFNVSVFESGGEVRVLPVAEILFRGYPPGKARIVGYEAKWKQGSFEFENSVRSIPTELEVERLAELRTLVKRTWRLTGCRDYARIDLRMGPEGSFQIIEVNANPDISPCGGFAAALTAAGVSFTEFVEKTVQNARDRVIGKLTVSDDKGGVISDGTAIRSTGPGDREAILRILDRTGFFRPDELTVASEVLDGAIERQEYQSYTCLDGGEPAGWVCFGKTPCTAGTFDLYWLAVSPDRQGRGIGRRLMEHAETLIGREGGHLIIVETSGRPDYEPTRRFYQALNYRIEAQISDFYAPGDSKIVFCKEI